MNVDNFVEENNRRPGTTDDVLGCLVTLKFQDKGVMCSLTNKLLNHVTKEDNKILAKTVKINEKESIGSEVRITPRGYKTINAEQDFLELNAEFCIKSIDEMIARAERR